jgi:alpha-L-arabinofuranosidase
VVKVVNSGGSARTMRLDVGRAGTGNRRAIVMASDPAAVNSLAEPTRVAPREEPLEVSGPTLMRQLPAHSVTVLRIPVR